MSRGGGPRELLRGPAMYGVVHVVLSWVYWLDSCAGVVAMMMLCVGDGMAEVCGGGPLWPWPFRNHWTKWCRKTLRGSGAMLVFGYAASAAACWLISGMCTAGAGGCVMHLGGLLAVCLVSTLVEALPIPDVDNITVPLAAIITAHFLPLTTSS
ncbi:phosphatidate cytidylyltransferase [Pelomyxa schiedti]|nr:phosphatidate cytidylyltransferase [Pelomyxa schiedti]